MEGKFPLKVIAERFFGENFAFRKKMGFSIPLKNIFSENDFRSYFHDLLLPKIKNRGIFNDSTLLNIMNNIDDIHDKEMYRRLYSEIQHINDPVGINTDISQKLNYKPKNNKHVSLGNLIKDKKQYKTYPAKRSYSETNKTYTKKPYSTRFSCIF